MRPLPAPRAVVAEPLLSTQKKFRVSKRPAHASRLVVRPRGKQFCFALTTPGRTYYMVATSDDERQAWIAALKAGVLLLLLTILFYCGLQLCWNIF